MKRHPVSDREQDRAALVEVAELVIVAAAIALVAWWLWWR